LKPKERKIRSTFRAPDLQTWRVEKGKLRIRKKSYRDPDKEGQLECILRSSEKLVSNQYSYNILGKKEKVLSRFNFVFPFWKKC
jgi:hypothetical protein